VGRAKFLHALAWGGAGDEPGGGGELGRWAANMLGAPIRRLSGGSAHSLPAADARGGQPKPLSVVQKFYARAAVICRLGLRQSAVQIWRPIIGNSSSRQRRFEPCRRRHD